MQHYILPALIVFLLITLNCQSPTTQEIKANLDTIPVSIPDTGTNIQYIPNYTPPSKIIHDYNKSKKLLHFQRDSLAQLLTGKHSDSLLLTSAGKVFLDSFIVHIVPHWYGTEWDFEGHTSVPGKGKVACGYFVSTSLRDAGLTLNRYRLAQQSPINEALSVNLGDSVFTARNIEELKNYCSSEGLYFIGMDFHVGLILMKEDDYYILHSDYIDASGVKAELVDSSEAVSHSQNYLLCPISSNKKLMKAWLTKKEMKIFAE